MSPDLGASLPVPRGLSLRHSPDFTRRVPDDLEPIFRDLPAAAPIGATVAPARIVRPSPERHGLRAASIGAIVAASLAGLSAGALVGHPAGLFAPRSAPAAAPAETTIPSPVAPLDAPSGEAARLAPAPRIEASAPVSPVAAQPIPARVRAAPVRVQKAKLPVRRGDVMAADRALRRAYARAIRAGAPRHVLVATRDQWDDLRAQASYDPQRAAGGYWKLSEQLDRVSARPGGSAPVRRHRGLLHLW